MISFSGTEQISGDVNRLKDGIADYLSKSGFSDFNTVVLFTYIDPLDVGFNAIATSNNGKTFEFEGLLDGSYFKPIE